MELFDLTAALLGNPTDSTFALFRGDRTGELGTLLFVLGVLLLDLFQGHVLTFLDRDVPQDFVFLSELLQDFVSGEVGPTLLAEVCAIGRIFLLLVMLGLAGGDASRVDLFD